MDNFESYFESDEGNLWSYIENKTYHLSDEDEEYQQILQKIEDILDEHPKLRDVFENNKYFDLSQSDAEALNELQTLYLNKRDIDLRNAFYVGGKNLYYYLKQMKIID